MKTTGNHFEIPDDLRGDTAENATAQNKLSDFVCPADKSSLSHVGDELLCSACGRLYPIIRGVPVLINDNNSVFRISDYATDEAYSGASGYGGALDKASGFRKAYHQFARHLSEAKVLGTSFDFISHIIDELPAAKILVIGSGERQYRGNVTYTDVAFANRIACICDSHDIPFPSQSFDAVVADSVLEHVCDPQRCVSEYIRVLKPAGFVFATTPFLQPVHMGAYDFTRFTHLGHRRLFRQFDEIASGQCGGPIYSGIHLFRDLLLCLTDNHRAQSILRLFGLLATYPVRYMDRLFSRTAHSYNCGCAFYFFGAKRETAISDRDIIKMFRGR